MRKSVLTCLFIATAIRPAQGLAYSSYKQIATGARHTCAISDGKVFCWGNGLRGQLGNGENGIFHAPVEVKGLPSRALAVATGAFHSCAILSRPWGMDLGVMTLSPQIVMCWGANDVGQLNDATTTDRNLPVLAHVGLRLGIKSISAGDQHTCVAAEPDHNQVMNPYRLACWGSNAHGQIRQGMELASPEIATGSSHTCVSQRRRTAVTYNTHKYYVDIRCFGSNAKGELGNGGSTSDLVLGLPEEPKIGSATPYPGPNYAITAGQGFTCALTPMTKTLYCWGDNSYGQLLTGTLKSSNVATKAVIEPALVRSLDAGREHACAVTTAGETWCWGRRGQGRLGEGSPRVLDGPMPYPAVVEYHLDATQENAIVETAAGREHSCSIREEWRGAEEHTRVLECWGSNGWGQLGLGSVLPFWTTHPHAVTF